MKYLFSLVVGVLLVGAFLWYQGTVSFLDEALEASGVVTDLVDSRSSDSSSYYPVVRFEDETGQLIEFQSSSGSNPASYSRGEKVSVFYLPGEPESARIDVFSRCGVVHLSLESPGGLSFWSES